MAHAANKAALFGGSAAKDGAVKAAPRSRTAGMGGGATTTGPRTAGLAGGSVTAAGPKTSGSSLTSPRGASPHRAVGSAGASFSQQRKEADELRKQANKLLEKTWNRWKPDYFSAAPMLERAANMYRTVGEDGSAVAAFTSAGDCQMESDAPAAAAKDYKEAAQIEARAGREEEAAKLFRLCAEAWLNANERGKCAEYLGRAAKSLETLDEDAAAADYLRAIDVMVPPDSDATEDFVRILGASEVFVQAIKFFVQQKKYAEALGAMERQAIVLQSESSEHSIFKLYLSQAVVCLAMGDDVRADKLFRDEHLQNTRYLYAPECKVEEDLITAFRAGDSAKLAAAKADRVLMRLDPALVRLSKSISCGMGEDDDDDGAFGGSGAPAARKPAATARGGTAAASSGAAGGFQERSAAAAARAASPRTVADVRARIGALGAAHGVDLPPAPSPRARSPPGGRPENEDEEGDVGGGEAEDVGAVEDPAAAALFARKPAAVTKKPTPLAGATGGRAPPPLPPRPNSPNTSQRPLPALPSRPAAAGDHRRSSAAGSSGGSADVDLGLDDFERSMAEEPEVEIEPEVEPEDLPPPLPARDESLPGDDIDLDAEIAAARLAAAKLAADGEEADGDAGGWADEYERDGASGGRGGSVAAGAAFAPAVAAAAGGLDDDDEIDLR